MRPGPRDHLVTQRLQGVLAAIDPALVDRVSLDTAEAPERLSRHVAAVIERVLHELAHDAEAQATLVNELVAARAGTDDRHGELLVVPPELRQGLRVPPERLGGFAPDDRGSDRAAF
jgi:hypothetical protein